MKYSEVVKGRCWLNSCDCVSQSLLWNFSTRKRFPYIDQEAPWKGTTHNDVFGDSWADTTYVA